MEKCVNCYNKINKRDFKCKTCDNFLWNINCKICDDEIHYSSKYSLKNAISPSCKKCRINLVNKIIGEKRKSGEILPARSKGFKTSKVTKEKLKISSTNNNGMKGKSVYSIWLERYGKDIADTKLSDFKSKISTANSGENNPMYGKPSPNGVGYGWQGWYKGWRFRSLLELSFMINVIERFKFNWESAEFNSNIKIYYTGINGNKRTYMPDFLLNNKYLIEVKPLWLQKSRDTLLKADAARLFCLNNNLRYKILDPGKLNDNQLTELYNNNLIKFDVRYEQLYKLKYEK